MIEQTSTPCLLLADEYIKQLLSVTRAAKRRIFMLFFVMTNDKETSKVIQEIIAAAKRGVNVHVAIDWISMYANKSFKETNFAVREFRRSGVKVHLLGVHNIMFLGRNHCKWYIADDTIFSFGGINLNDTHLIDHSDYMLRIDDNKFADILCREQLKIERNNKRGRKVRGHSVKIGDDRILFDGSFYNSSLIYRRSIELAKEADEILYVSQYHPTGQLSRVMLDKNARTYANSPDLAYGPDTKLMISLSQKSSGQKNTYTRKRYIHAKFMIFTMPDGSKKALLGSHNFFKLTSIVGTREIDLETSNPEIIAQLEKFFRDNIE